MRLLSSALLLLSLSSVPALAQTTATPAIAAPDVSGSKPYSGSGLSFQLPGNWRVTNNQAMDSGGGRLVNIEADKADFATLGLDASIQIFPTATAPDLDGTASFLYNLRTEGSKDYTKPSNKAVKLGGRYPGLAARYSHTIFGKDRPYAHPVDLVAIKPCGEGWVCILFSQTLAANEKAGSTGLAKIYETIRYAP